MVRNDRVKHSMDSEDPLRSALCREGVYEGKIPTHLKEEWEYFYIDKEEKNLKFQKI